jgi:hypothetical protein
MTHKKKSSHKKRRVSSPRSKKRRRIGAGGPMYTMSGKRGKRRRRMGKPAKGYKDALLKYAMMMLGGGIADVALQLTDPYILPALNNNKILVGVGKVGVGAGAFMLTDNAFIQGIGIGMGVSGTRNLAMGAGLITGPSDRDMYVVVPGPKTANANRAEFQEPLSIMNAEKSVIGAEKSVIGVGQLYMSGARDNGMMAFDM